MTARDHDWLDSDSLTRRRDTFPKKRENTRRRLRSKRDEDRRAHREMVAAKRSKGGQ